MWLIPCVWVRRIKPVRMTKKLLSLPSLSVAKKVKRIEKNECRPQ